MHRFAPHFRQIVHLPFPAADAKKVYAAFYRPAALLTMAATARRLIAAARACRCHGPLSFCGSLRY